MPNALRNFAKIMIRPREVMRRILDAGRDRAWIAVVLLAALSVMIGDFDAGEVSGLQQRGAPFALILVVIFVVGMLVFLGFFYLVAWAAYWLGKVMEGSGTPAEVRRALGWGHVPLVWALLYRIPAAFVTNRAAEPTLRVGRNISFSSAQFGENCATMLLFGLLELAALVWLVVVASNTIGEAHRFSSWRGFATLLLVAISPIVIVIAAVLAM